MHTEHAAASDWRRHAGDFAWPTLALAALTVGGHIAMWWVVAADHVALPIGVAVNTVLAYVAFTPAHEAAHGNIRGNRRGVWARAAQEGVGWVSAALLLAPYAAFRALHLRHHAHPNRPGRDPDLWVSGKTWWGTALRCVTILVYYYYEFFVGPASRGVGIGKVRRRSVVGLAALAVAFAVLWAVGLGSLAVWLWVVPAVIATPVLAFLFDWLPHHPHTVVGRMHDTRVLLGRGLGPSTLGQSYHLIHHLYPRIPFYRYRACFDATRTELVAQGATITRLW